MVGLILGHLLPHCQNPRAARVLKFHQTEDHRMMTTQRWVRRATARDMHFFQNPQLWPYHPFLPLSRQAQGSNERQLGLLYDARGASGTYGYAAPSFWPTCSSSRRPRQSSSACPSAFTTPSKSWPTTAGAWIETAR